MGAVYKAKMLNKTEKITSGNLFPQHGCLRLHNLGGLGAGVLLGQQALQFAGAIVEEPSSALHVLLLFSVDVF